MPQSKSYPSSCESRRACVLLGLTIQLLALSSTANTNSFPIMPWNWIPNDVAVIKRIRDCGFTVAGFVAPNTLDACQQVGLRAIVSDARSSGYEWANVDEAKTRKNIESLIAEVGNHPAVFGYYLRDEPEAGWFSGLNKVASAVRELAPGKWPYINLFPDYATNEQLGTTNYTEYLERFIATCKPRIISYDNYSIMDDGSLRESYWTNIEAVRSASKRHGLDFWNIVLSVAQFNYREASAADLRFQAYSTLAYGGRGLSYFTYFAPAVGGYRNAPVDQFGNETPTWHHLQNVNLQVQKLGPTLLELTSDDVYHIGKIPGGCRGPQTNSLVSSVPGDVFLVGEFTHRDGSRYVMVVNKDFAKGRSCRPHFRKPPKSLNHISPYTGNVTPYEGEHVWLAPGQGVLLKPEW